MSEIENRFSIHTREKKKGPIFYVQFKNDDGTWTTAKSSGIVDQGRKKDYQAAVSWAVHYLKSGKVVLKERVTVKDIAEDFFSWDGEWATNRRVAQKRVSLRQCKEKQSATDEWIIKHLGEEKLKNLDKVKIRNFRNMMFNKGKSGSRINKVLSCLSAVLEYAEEKRYIQAVPTIERAGDKGRSRGILSPDEVRKIFSLHWPNYEAYVMNLVAATTGARQGELLGLQRKNVDFKRLELRLERAWERQVLVLNESTKTGKTRVVPITNKVAGEIQKVMNKAPWKEPDNFVFFHPDRPDRPMYGEDATEALFTAMEGIGITKAKRTDRYIDFHSWRHWLNSLLLNKKIPAQKVQAIVGHLTTEMTQNYYHVDDGDDIRQLTDGAFKEKKKKKKAEGKTAAE